MIRDESVERSFMEVHSVTGTRTDDVRVVVRILRSVLVGIRIAIKRTVGDSINQIYQYYHLT